MTHPYLSRARAAAAVAALSLVMPFGAASAQGDQELLARAVTLRDAGKLDDAAFAFRSAIRANPTSGKAHYELGLIYLKQNKDALAKAALFRAAALTPSDSAVIVTIGRNSERLAGIPLDEAYAARDRQEAEDAKRKPAAADPPPAPKQPERVTPPPAPAAPKPVRLQPLAPKAGYLIGRVVTEDGRPVPQFTIDYSGFEDGKLANTNASGGLTETVNSATLGKNGQYAVKLPPGAYRAGGYVTYQFKGRTYHFALEPVGDPTYDYKGLRLENLRGGLVRDFVLKMTGKRKDGWETSETGYKNAYYGGRVDLYADEFEGLLGGGNKLSTPLRSAYPPESRIALLLVPQGPMVDGTTGRPVSANLALGDDGKWTFMVRGVYPGVYAASANLVTPTGETIPLRVSLTSRETIRKPGEYDRVVVNWQPSVTIDFPPNDLGPVPRMGVKAVRLYLGK